MICERNCPICGTGRNELIWEENFGDSSHVLMKKYAVNSCTKCGMAYVNPVPEQSDWDEYYTRTSKYDSPPKNDGGYDEARFSKVASFFENNCILKNSSILDVGCGSGRLLRILRQHGYSKLFGLDPSPKVAEYFCGEKGIAIKTGAVSDFKPDCSYDLIALMEVLEHVMDLESFLRKITNMQKPSGMLYIEVPDASKFMDCSDGPFQQFSVEHINFFSHKLLKRLMIRFGYISVAEKQYMHTIAKNIEVSTMMSLWKKQLQDQPLGEMINEQDRQLTRELARYIEKSSRCMSEMQKIIGRVVDQNKEIIVWGAGTLTLRLLSQTSLKAARIRVFVDSNPNYQGQMIGNVPIVLPTQIVGMELPILVSSYISQQEIVQQIRTEMGLQNQLILLTEGMPCQIF
jgi:SAM-dependent methyltransferase